MPSDVQDKIMEMISDALKRRDIFELERLTRGAKQAQELESAKRSINEKLEALVRRLSLPEDSTEPAEIVSSTDASKQRGKIRITIDWKSAGISRDKAVIEERMGSKTLVRFLAEVHNALGDPALEKLTGLKISRGPLVSPNPERDFINPGKGSVYMNHRIARSGYFVITHSGTAEKIDAINSAARLLGLNDAVSVQRS